MFDIVLRHNLLSALYVRQDDGKTPAFIDVYDVAPPSGSSMPQHLHRIAWPTQSKASGDKKRRASLTTPQLCALTDSLWCAFGGDLFGWRLVDLRRSRRATKRLGKLEQVRDRSLSCASCRGSRSARGGLSESLLLSAKR